MLPFRNVNYRLPNEDYLSTYDKLLRDTKNMPKDIIEKCIGRR